MVEGRVVKPFSETVIDANQVTYVQVGAFSTDAAQLAPAIGAEQNAGARLRADAAVDCRDGPLAFAGLGARCVVDPTRAGRTKDARLPAACLHPSEGRFAVRARRAHHERGHSYLWLPVGPLPPDVRLTGQGEITLVVHRVECVVDVVNQDIDFLLGGGVDDLIGAHKQLEIRQLLLLGPL